MLHQCKVKSILGRISSALCWLTLSEVLEYWCFFFNLVFDLFEGISCYESRSTFLHASLALLRLKFL